MFPRKPHPTVSVVICALNEEKNLINVLPKIPEWVDEIILMDGHSIDKTVKVAKEMRPGIRVLLQPNTGKGEAFKYGVAASIGEIVVTLDADGTYPAEEISKFVDAILSGYDFAKGSRFIGAKPDCMPRNRQFGNKILALTSNLLFQSRYTDICSGYYAFKKEIFNEIPLISEGFEIETELFVKVAKLGYKVTEVPHSYCRRLYGASRTQDFRQGFRDIVWMINLFISTRRNLSKKQSDKNGLCKN
jgi:glycosyltransferase involved in cell wall biosynthesis